MNQTKLKQRQQQQKQSSTCPKCSRACVCFCFCFIFISFIFLYICVRLTNFLLLATVVLSLFLLLLPPLQNVFNHMILLLFVVAYVCYCVLSRDGTQCDIFSNCHLVII